MIGVNVEIGGLIGKHNYYSIRLFVANTSFFHHLLINY